MTLKNTAPGIPPVMLPKGTRLVSAGGVAFRTTQKITVPPATVTVGAAGQKILQPSATDVFVESVHKGRKSVVSDEEVFSLPGLSATQQETVYGEAQGLDLRQEDFQGIDVSYIFDPATERYEKVSNLTIARWYPSLVNLADGKVLAVSGLDGFGHIIPGEERALRPATDRWTTAPQLTRQFSTYPALFLMDDGRLFFSGSVTGYGPRERRTYPWHLGSDR